MNCDDARTLVDAAIDGELDVMTQVGIDEHVETCSSCKRVYEARRAVQAALRTSDLYHRAPAGLERRIRRAAGPAPARWFSWRPALAAAAIVVFAIAGLLVFRARETAGDSLAREIVASHVRSLLPGHLTDVVSSDQHTVKPWFAGRVDFSPPVADLRNEGFPLVGGRLDYVADRTVAALVYQRNKHVVNVFVWPAAEEAAERDATMHGYNVVHWSHAGLACWAVSDLNAAELDHFVRLLRQTTAP